MTDQADTDQADWECDWDSHERAQVLRAARHSLIEKVAWLEEAHRLVIQLQRSRKARSVTGGSEG